MHKNVIFSTISFRSVTFSNNFEAGLFVMKLVNGLSSTVKESFTFAKDVHSSALFVDGGVYTKNRNFRTFLSRKFGAWKRPLVASELMREWRGEENLDPKKVFVESLVTNVEPGSSKHENVKR